MKKIDLGVVVTTLIIVTISCSLAFFAARIVGNPKDINLVAKNVAITFTDTSSIADETISPGWNNVKSFTITNNSKEDFNYNILLKGLVNTFESINTLQYKITSDTGYNMDNYLNIVKTENSKDVVLAYDVVIPKGSKQTYQVEFKYISIDEDQSSDMGKKLGGTLAIEESTGKPKIYDKLLSDNPTIKTRTDFSTTLTETNVNTLYKAKENNTDVYYFAGDARNNWVKFGGYYWRIIRTNSDGSIRLLYHSTSPEATDAYIGKTCWYKDSSGNCIYNSENYLYYTYDDNESEIKKMVESWYASNLINYDKYISKNTVYCNDKEYQSFDIPEIKVFNAYVRATGQNGQNSDWSPIYNGKISPTYNCNITESQYTYKYSGIGNQLLSYPIGLITADEIVYAGSSFELNNGNIWHIKNSDLKSSFGDNNWWTMSPSTWNTARSFNSVVRSTYARIEGHASYEDYYVRPVISLKKDLLYKSGDGSATNPYEAVADPVNMYTASLTVNNGSGTGTVLVEEGKDAKFTVVPNSGYKVELETNTCGGTLSGNTYTINNITSNKTCSIAFKKNGTSLATLIRANAVNENGYRYEGSNPNNYIQMQKSDNTTEMWRIIGLFPDGENGEDIIRVRKVGYESKAYNSTYENHWPTSTLYSTWSSTYSTTNYKNTVNYKMYLGTSSPFTYTSADLYQMERVIGSKGSAGPSSGGKTAFVGSVGLMYPSDYGYAVLSSDCARTIKPCSFYTTSSCYKNNWLYQGSSSWQWLINPYVSSPNFAFIVRTEGYVDYRFSSADGGQPLVTSAGLVSPVMALKADVTVTGSGTQSDPYVMN